MTAFIPKVEFNLVSDPSHGWLLVPEPWIFASCLEPTSFTSFSYVNARHIYALEEDLDAPKFIRAFATQLSHAGPQQWLQLDAPWKNRGYRLT